MIVVDRNVTQIRVQLDALPKDALDALGGAGATDKIAPQANGNSWQLTKVAADVTIEYSTGDALVKTVSVGINLNKDVKQTVPPQTADWVPYVHEGHCNATGASVPASLCGSSARLLLGAQTTHAHAIVSGDAANRTHGHPNERDLLRPRRCADAVQDLDRRRLDLC